MTDGKVRLGIIGFGQQGPVYARLIAEGRVPSMVVGAVADVDPAKKDKADEMGLPFFNSAEELMDSGLVDAVVTTIPHYDHPAVGIAALERGLGTLIEKPAAVYTKQAEELFACADAHPDVAFGIMFNQRTNQLYVDLKNLIESGELGKLRHTSWIITNWWRPDDYYGLSPWRATWGGEGGGVLVNQSPHQLDLWQWLCGVPKKVFARLGFGFRRDIATEDEVNAVVDFGDGASGHFMTCTHDAVGTDRLEILLDAGKIVVDNSKDVTIYRLKDDERKLSADIPWSKASKVLTGDFDQSQLYDIETKSYQSVWGEQHALALENFGQHMLTGAALIAPGRDGINGVKLANAMQLSAWTGEDVDMDNFDEQRYLDELNQRIRAEGDWPQRN